LPEEMSIHFLLVPSLVICWRHTMYPSCHNKPCTWILLLKCILHSMQSSSCILESNTISSLLCTVQHNKHSGPVTKEIIFSRQFESNPTLWNNILKSLSSLFDLWLVSHAKKKKTLILSQNNQK
jgi:hypothetical protein